jgi:WD40 repeat protein
MSPSRACLLLLISLALLQIQPAQSEPAAGLAQTEKPPARTDLYGDPLPPCAIARMGRIRLRHLGHLNAIAFSPDGKVIASGGGGLDDGLRIRFWDIHTGAELRAFVADADRINSVAFSPDGKLLAAGGGHTYKSGTRAISIWDVATGKQLHKLGADQMSVTCVAFSPDSRLLASGSQGGQLHLWDVATGKPLHAVDAHGWEVSCVCFSPDGKLLASASTGKDPTIHLWDPASGKQLGSLRSKDEHFYGASWLSFSTEGKVLASAGAPSSPYIHEKRTHDTKARLWDVAKRRELRAFEGGQESPDSVALSSDGKILAVPAGKSVRLYDVTSGKELPRLNTEAGPIRRVAFSTDGRSLAGAVGRTIGLWDVATGKERFAPAGDHREELSDIALTPDGKLLASADNKDTVFLWEATTGKMLHRMEDKFVHCVALSPDGKLLASGGYRGVRLWDTKTGKELRQLAGEQKHAASRRLAFAPDGKSLASYHKIGSSDENEVRLWDIATGQKIRTLKAAGQAAIHQTLAYCQAGKLLAAADGDFSIIQLWDAATGKEIRRLKDVWRGSAGGEIAFCPKGTYFAMTTGIGTRLFEVATGRDVARFPTLNKAERVHDNFFSLAFSPDGKTLAAGAYKGEIRLWDTTTGKERGRLTGHQAPVNSLVFSADGKFLASGSWDGTALMWDVSGIVRKSAP